MFLNRQVKFLTHRRIKLSTRRVIFTHRQVKIAFYPTGSILPFGFLPGAETMFLNFTRRVKNYSLLNAHSNWKSSAMILLIMKAVKNWLEKWKNMWKKIISQYFQSKCCYKTTLFAIKFNGVTNSSSNNLYFLYVDVISGMDQFLQKMKDFPTSGLWDVCSEQCIIWTVWENMIHLAVIPSQ